MTIRIAPPKHPQHDRISQAELHALDRRLAVMRLKDQLFPVVGRLRRWRRLQRRLLGWLWG